MTNQKDVHQRDSRIQWSYLHHLNSISVLERTKRGKFCGLCRHTERHWRKTGTVQMAYVLFDGNKRQSLVPLKELEMIAETQ